MRRRIPIVASAAMSTALVLGCATDSSTSDNWRGTIDTLTSGTVVVQNPDTGLWTPETEWRLEEVVRLGSVDEPGPELFGRIRALEVDALGRIYVFDAQANELRIFEPGGVHVRTVGGEGGGPGEFQQVIGMAWGSDGNLWIVDPSNNRVSIIDTSGSYVTSHRMPGNYVVVPWPGGVDREGRFYTYAQDPSAAPFGFVLVQYSVAMEPLDTIQPPRQTGSDHYYEYSHGGSGARASVPFSSRLVWRLAPSSDIWFALTGEYKLYQTTLTGDTVRTIAKQFEPIAVTRSEADSAVERLEWFTRQGGHVERSKIPSHKPAIRDFILGDDGTLWVNPNLDGHSRRAIDVLDVFDPEGRYLGRLDLPSALLYVPAPIVRNGMLYGVTQDDLGVSYVVSARLVR
jgi:hypothetical protein